MKKAMIITFSLVFIVALSGCTSSNENTNTNQEQNNTSQTGLEHSAINQAEEAVGGYEDRLDFITGE